MSGARLSSIAFMLIAAVSWTCGGESDPVCGDGVRDPGEQCDDGNDDDTDACFSDCTARDIPTLTIKWEFNRDASPGFTGDSCTDLGVREVEVELSGPGGPIIEKDGCSFRQVVFVDLPAGEYTAEVRPLDGDGVMIIDEPVVGDVDFGGGHQEAMVVVPPSSWTRSYTGTLFFRLAWEGEDCESASPPVAEQLITLVAGGAIFEGETTDGAPVDGSDGAACRSNAEQFPQTVLDVPFGAAEIDIVGLDGEGQIAYESHFETFIGAGVNNPELSFDVARPSPDAGIDPDGGVASDAAGLDAAP